MSDAAVLSHDSPIQSAFHRMRLWWKQAFGHSVNEGDSLELVQRRIYVLPSARGWSVIVIAIVLLLVGVNYQLSLAYVVSFLLGGLLQVALHATYRNLRGAVIRVGKSPRVIAGETLQFAISVASPERAREGISITRLALTGRAQRAALFNAPRIRLAADAIRLYPIDVTTTKRGIVSLGRVLIESRAPYGLIRAWSYANFEWIGWVEPKPEMPYPELPHAVGEDAKTTAKQDVAHDPDSLREYVPGDSLKRVAWKHVAKSGEWYTRTGEIGQRGEVDLRWDATQLSDTEARLARMAAWIDRARNEGVAFSLTLPNAQLPLADSAPHHDEALMSLAAFPTPVGEVRGVRR